MVVAIVEDHVHSVYRIMGIERTGTTRTLVSDNFRNFDIALGYPELPAKLFIGVLLDSASLGLLVRGWISPRNSVARSDGSLFDTVEVDLAH